MLNGIDAVAKSSDLLDRAFLVELPVIPAGNRMTEERLWARFNEVHAGVLGALCDALVCALRRVHDVELAELPRMADAAKWVTAAESALGWDEGQFARMYGSNRDESHEVAIDASPIGPALLKVADEGFHGAAGQLLTELETKAGVESRKDGRLRVGSRRSSSGSRRTCEPSATPATGGRPETRAGGSGRSARSMGNGLHSTSGQSHAFPSLR
jgi:hypothetical protein